MITPQQAEALSIKAVEDYLESCGCVTGQDKANALMKLCSVAGIVMVNSVGADETVARLIGTADFIRLKTANTTWVKFGGSA